MKSKPVDASVRAAGWAVALVLAGGSLAGLRPGKERPNPPAGEAPAPPAACADGPALAAAEVEGLLLAAAGALGGGTMTVAVVDRLGTPLGLFRQPAADPANDDRAVGLARTGAFFSHNQAPLSSRTVRFLSGVHFPPGVKRTPNAALYGIENTNRGCDLGVVPNPGVTLPWSGALAGGVCKWPVVTGCGTGPVTGKEDVFDSDQSAVDPGGLPVFRHGEVLVGGIGVAGVPPAHAEFAALEALRLRGFLPRPKPPGVVVIDGIRLPFVKQTSRPPGTAAGPGFSACGAVPAPGGCVIAPADGACAADGYLSGPVAGPPDLSLAEVTRIVQQSVAAAARTRGVIRLPLGSRARMAIAVGDRDGRILALYRMPDATIFSIDVAVAKARNVVWTSGAGAADLPGVPPGTAVTNRTIGFGAQPFYPPGIDGSGPGPFFDLFERDWMRPCTQGSQPANPNQNGVVFFAGSVPLYEGATLVGGLGISGDGVEQDDYVAYRGAEGFLPPRDRWADRRFVAGVRLPFLKFPRNPEG
ncbi:MAG TPA: heme-binding protein [Thermoanaerobaculia bacterium]